jgi:ABC-type multidrug transport system fused ATPase/permease subunit
VPVNKTLPLVRKLWALLTPAERRSAIVVCGLMLVGMVLETLGVGLVIPVLALLTQTDLAARYGFAGPLLRALGNPSHETLVVGGMVVLVAFYALKTAFLSLVAWRQMGFVFGLQTELSERLFSLYLRQPYTFHLERNSAELIRNVIGQVGDITTVVLAGLLLVTEAQVLVGVACLLVVVEPVGAIAVALALGGAGFLFHRLTRAAVLHWGDARQVHEMMRIRYLQEGVAGAKAVKLHGREDDFVEKFRRHNDENSRVGRLANMMQQLPRLVIELLAIAALATLVIVIVARGRDVGTILPTIGVFAAAAFRLMPSVSRMLGSLQSLKYVEPAVNAMYREFQCLSPAAPSAAAAPLRLCEALTLDHVTFRYPTGDAPALRDVCLTVACGRSAGFVGASGAGKSTLVDVLLGLLTPEGGTIRVDGVDIQTNLRGWQDRIGYVPQEIFLTDDTLRRNVAFGLPDDRIDEAAVKRAVVSAQLEAFVNELPLGLETVVGERGVRLSGGQRQRIGIARALYHDPDVLVLDEATSSLDTETERGVMDAVRVLHGRKTILIVAHRTTTVAHCDRLFRLEQGRMIEEGEAAAVLGATARLSRSAG